MRDWLNSILGQDGGRVAQFALALVAVVLLILLLAWVVRRLQPGARLIAVTGGKSKKRLGVLEASDVDARRRLVLVRRDDVEHLIMIGGPNDLLIESRILRSGHATSRPNVQHMPRPAAAVEGDRIGAPLAGSAPTGPSLPALAVLAPQAMAPQIAEPQIAQMPSPVPAPASSRMMPDEEPELPLPPVAAPPAAATPPFAKPQFAPPPFVPPTNRPPMTSIAPTPPTPVGAADARRPSLSDLLNAATAAKVTNPRDLPQPMTAPPPMPRMRPPQPDLEEDDRDMPTQIVARRAPQPPSEAPPTAVFEEPASRETEVATQIERALADLNPVLTPAEAPVPAEPRSEPEQPLPQPQLLQPRRPTLEPIQTTTAPITRPLPGAAAPTMPPIPLRPTPPARLTVPERAALPERPSLPERPAQPERPALAGRSVALERPAVPERIEPASRPALEPEQKVEDRAPTGPGAPFVPTIVAEPIAAPRPLMAPVPRPPSLVSSEPVAPAPPPAAPAPVSSAQQKTDELEEEMAKLLSELGGSSSR